MTTNIWLTCGAPGSGKTYWAKQVQQAALANGKTVCRIERDMILEDCLFGGDRDVNGKEVEQLVTATQEAIILEWLSNATVSGVIVSDTTQDLRTFSRLADMASRPPMFDLTVVDFRHVCLRVCEDRVRLRNGIVGHRKVPVDAVAGIWSRCQEVKFPPWARVIPATDEILFEGIRGVA